MTDSTNPLNPVTILQNGAVVSSSNPISVSGSLSPTPAGATVITGNATGTTGAVVGTLAAAAAKTTYISGFSVSAVGDTATVGPITVAGLVGSSMIFYLTSSVVGSTLTVNFNQPIPASAVNTAITVTTTADATASNVAVNTWGFQL